MAFAERVCGLFALGGGPSRMTAHRGSSQRLWVLSTPGGRFVVKEFPYDGEADRARLVRAAEFEVGVWRSGRVRMPEPIGGPDGQLIQCAEGSSGTRLAVRVHRWMDGAAVPVPPAADTARAAGRELAAIQRAGSAFESKASGTLRWWSEQPYMALGRMRQASLLTAAEAAAAGVEFEQAMALIAAAERLPGPWGFTHCDHKPENSLLADGGVAVLDWDECGPCHPRLEAVEAALRWAAGDRGEPAPNLFRAFLEGYQESAGPLGALRPVDFGKWMAALVGWFTFCAQRALGDFGDTPAEAANAAEMARDTQRRLAGTRAALDRWAHTLAAP